MLILTKKRCYLMTDKEQMMINGVDVSGCKFFNDITERYYCFGIPCKDRPNCCYKQLKRKEQECEELKRKLSNQEQLYENEIEIYNNSCLRLRQENDDLYLERLALNTANSGINALLEVKEQECDRYRKALEEIEIYIKRQGIDHKWNMHIQRFKSEILSIINKVKDDNK